jgi:hypothetical protein
VKTFSANPLISNEATLHNPANPRRRVKEAEDFGDRPVDRTAKAVGSRKLSLRSEKLGPSWLKVVTVQVIEAAAQRLAIERGGALPGHPDARRPV